MLTLFPLPEMSSHSFLTDQIRSLFSSKYLQEKLPFLPHSKKQLTFSQLQRILANQFRQGGSTPGKTTTTTKTQRTTTAKKKETNNNNKTSLLTLKLLTFIALPPFSELSVLLRDTLPFLLVASLPCSNKPGKRPNSSQLQLLS